MTIKLDGKNNIIDNAYADLKDYKKSTPQITENEKQKIMKEINDKVTKDWYNKPVLTMKKTIESDYGDPMQKATQLEIGTKIESEHKDTFKFIKDYRKKHGEYPPEEMVYKQIARDHLSEFKDYYTRLIAMEKQAEQEMSKAKYIKKVPDGKGGWKYFYAEPKDKREKKIEEKKESKSNILREMLPSYYNYTEKDLKRITDLLPDNNFFATKEESYNDNNWSEENTTGYKEYEVKNGKMFFGLDGVQELQKDIPSPEYPYFFRATNNTKEPELGDFKSTNYVTGQKEKGMSVSPHPRYAVFNNLKHLYAVTGEIVGYGSDGEPLLTNVKFLKKLNIKEAEKEHTIKKLESGIKFLKDKGMNDSGKILNVLMRLKGYNLESSESLQKAKKDLTKLIKKVIINSKGVQQTVYTLPEGAKTEWLNKFMQFFNFKDSRQANQKLEADYKANNLDKKGVTWQQWKDHVAEYFNNKDKWDRFFNKSTEQKKETAKKEEQKAKKSNKKPKTAVYKLSLMKFIAGMYGKAPEKPIEKPIENNFETMPESVVEPEPEPVKEETPEQKAEDKKIVTAINEATPENRPETEAKVFGEIKQEWAIPFAEYKKSLIEYRNKRVIDELESRVRYYTKELEPERLKQVSGDIENYKKLISARKERYEKTLKEYLNGELNDRLKPEYSWGYMQREYDSMKDKDSAEAKSLKRKLTSKENKAKQEHERLIRKAIKEGNVIPANVLKEYPEIQKNDASKMTIPDINYKPIEKEKTVFLGAVEDESTKRNIKIYDYTKVPPKDVYLVDEENILNVPRPSYIPEMDLEDFAGYKGSSQIFDIVRIEPNKYIIVDKRYPVRRVMDRREEYDPRSAYTVYEGKKVTDEERAEYNKRTIEKRNYFEMNAETLAATWDYYRKLYRAKQRQEFEEKQDREEAYYNKQKQKTLEAGKEWKYAPFKRKTIRPKTVSPDSNKMSFSQAFMIQDFTGIKAPVSEFTGPTRMNLDLFMNYQAMLRELDYKINDLRLQRQYDNENSTYKKGQETAYGDSGTKPDLLESKGVLVKRQNGSEIDDQDVGKIGMLLDDLYSVFGDRSSMSKKYGLKISYAGEKRMHASKAVGLFIDKYKCIAVSDFSIEGRGFTVAHEYAHFMDSYIGDQKGYHFSSDQEGSTSNAIASTFRDKLNLKLDPSSRKEAGADYYKRTCECFARAMEQYYAIKQGTENVLYDSYDAKKIGIYVEHDKFMKDIFPLCDKFLTENEELLKAFHKEFDNNKKVFIKKKNPLTGKFEYRKVK